MVPRGPFQVRNFTNWIDPVYCTPAYAGGWAIEFTWFYYTGKASSDYDGYLIATDSSDSWICDYVCCCIPWLYDLSGSSLYNCFT